MSTGNVGSALESIWVFVKELIPFAALAIAWSGLSTWRKQLRGTTAHAAAFQVLRVAIRLRNGINGFRYARIFRVPETEARTNEDFLQARYTQHRERLLPILDAYNDLATSEIDAAVLFGDVAVRNVLNPLTNCVDRLVVAFEERYQNALRRVRNPDSSADALDRELSQIVFGEPTDEFGRSLESAFNAIHAFFTPHLR